MAKSRRSYKGAAVANALASGTLAAGGTSINLASAMSGWSTDGTPFFIVIDPGTAKEEKVCVKYNTSTNLTVVDPAVTSSWTASANGRGADNTTDRQHDAGAVVYPVFTATEADQANELVSKYTTNGDIVVHGTSTVKTISTGGSGGNNKVLVADSTVSDGGVKWGQVATAGIADDAVTAAKILAGAVGTSEIADANVTLAKLASAVANALVPVGTIAAYAGVSAPTGWLLCNGTSTSGYTSLAALVGATTPDMRGRFPIGDNATLTLLGTGGSLTIAEANLPSHSHTFSATSGAMSANASPSHSITDPGHSHTIDTFDPVNGGSQIGAPEPGYGADAGTEANVVNSNTTGISIAAHDIAHTHSVSGTTGTGSGSGTDYYPPHLVVNYIIKHD